MLHVSIHLWKQKVNLIEKQNGIVVSKDWEGQTGGGQKEVR